jgi:hypothetical protein
MDIQITENMSVIRVVLIDVESSTFSTFSTATSANVAGKC